MKEYMHLLLYTGICMTAIFIRGFLRCKYNMSDFLLIKLNIGDLDGWSVTHVLYNLFLGYQFPNLFVEIMLLGIIWEILETIFGYFPGVFDCKVTTDADDWWFGRVSDIIMNFIGASIGYSLKTFL